MNEVFLIFCPFAAKDGVATFHKRTFLCSQSGLAGMLSLFCFYLFFHMQQLSALLSFIALASFVVLVIGLISPAKVSKLVKCTLCRKQIIAIFGGGFLALVFISGSIVPEIPAKLPQPKQEEIKTTVNNQVSTSTEIAATSTNTTEKTTKQKPVVQQPVNPNADSNLSVAKEEVKIDLYLVVRIVDGDTIELEGGQKVRYIGVDTPESVSTKQSVECFGKEASAKNKELVVGKKVRLEKDVSETDRYGRLLRYVYLEDNTFVNDYMVRQGYAYAYTYPPDVKHSKQFVDAQKEAKENGRGLWSPTTCNGQNQLPTTNTTTNNTQTELTTPITQTTHTWYTSSHYKAQYYYCDTDEGWKALSPSYLKSFGSVEELLKKYPNRTLHQDC